jgi:hypothetical protein
MAVVDLITNFSEQKQLGDRVKAALTDEFYGSNDGDPPPGVYSTRNASFGGIVSDGDY